MRKLLWNIGPGLTLYLLVMITVGSIFLRTAHDILLYAVIALVGPIIIVVLVPLMFAVFEGLNLLWDKLLPDQAEAHRKDRD